MEKGKLNPTVRGAAQGSVISSALTVLALSGLEDKIRPKTQRQRDKEKTNVVIYADDFIVTAASADLLKEKVMPKLEEVLKTVGLELSLEKTKITAIEDGFDFLRFHIRKYRNGRVFTKPSKASIKAFRKEIRDLIKRGIALPTERLIHALNEKITGWCNYYRCVVSSKVFNLIDNEIFLALKRWIIKKYYTRYKGDNWRFYCPIKGKDGKNKPLLLKKASDTKIRRHMKIIANANPFDPAYKDYFVKREEDRKRRRLLSFDTELTGLKIIQPY